MNRRSFFARFLGAACIALAERVVPAALVKAEAATPDYLAWGPAEQLLQKLIEDIDRKLLYGIDPAALRDGLVGFSGFTEDHIQ